MTNVSAHTPVFPRGSGVLDYWLAHAEGLTVEPLGARVERVVVAAPAGHAETLIVRSRVTRRRKSIPATSIAAVEPSTGHLLLEPKEKRERRPLPRPTARPVTGVARATGAGAVVVARSSRAGARASYAWSRPHALRLGTAAGRTVRTAAEQTRAGAVWFAPRVRTAAVATARATYTGALLVARGGAVAACELERGLTHALARGAAAVERRRRRRVGAREGPRSGAPPTERR